MSPFTVDDVRDICSLPGRAWRYWPLDAAGRADQAGLDLLAAQLDTERRATENKDGPAMRRPLPRIPRDHRRPGRQPAVRVLLEPLQAQVQWHLFHLTSDRDAHVKCHHEHEELLAAIAEQEPGPGPPPRRSIMCTPVARTAWKWRRSWSRVDIDPIELTKSGRAAAGRSVESSGCRRH